MIPFSVLDLSPIVEGGNAAQSFRNTLDLVQHAERWGFQRYWVAEQFGTLESLYPGRIDLGLGRGRADDHITDV